MRILVAVKAGMLQHSILNILKEVPGTQLIIYSKKNIPVNELKEGLSIVITDTGQEGSKSEDLFRVLKAGYPALRVLIIGAAEHCEQLFDWLCTGAVAAMLDSEIKTCLLPAIMQVKNGTPILSAIISRQLLLTLGYRKTDLSPTVDYDLTPREKNVLTAIVKGLTYKMAAHKLNISPETVRGHIKNIYKKLMVNSQSQAVARAIYHKLV